MISKPKNSPEPEYWEEEELPPPPQNGAFRKLIAGFTAFIVFILSIEGYFYLIHPEPIVRKTLAEVQTFIRDDGQTAFTTHQPEEVKNVLMNSAHNLKQIANFIAADSCRTSDSLCQSKALFYFVRDRITYVADPDFHDQLENPLVVLKSGGADCEDMAVLLAGLELAIGNEARLIKIPGHVYTQIRISDYSKKWINLEPTCKSCKFGEIPTENQWPEKEIISL